MTDIIVRLEQRYQQTAEPECDLIQEAARVIDHLRDELAVVRADAALLREQLASLQASSGYEISIAQVEIERLKTELETQKAISNQIQSHLEHEELRSYKAEADNERLRAALESIAKNTCCDRCQEAALVARHVLEPKP